MLSFSIELFLGLCDLSTIIIRLPTWIVAIHRLSQTDPAERFLAFDAFHMFTFLFMLDDCRAIDTGSVFRSFVLFFLVSVLCIVEVEDASQRGIPQKFIQKLALLVSTEVII